MSGKLLENNDPGTAAFGLQTNKAVKFGSTLNVTGNFTGHVEQYTDPQNQVAAASWAVSHSLYINDNLPTAYQLAAVTVSFGTASTSGTLQVEVATGTQAIGAGTNQLTGTVSLAGTANTAVSGTVIASPTTISAGSRVNLIFAGTVTNLANAIVVITLRKTL